MAMNNEFADWYRIASVSPTAEQVTARWMGVEAASAGLTATRVIDLVRLYALKPDQNYEAPEYFDKAFRDHDTLFPKKGNTEELRILSGTILRNVIDTKTTGATAVAYGIVCSTLANRREGISVKDHISSAERYLTERAKAVRDSKVAAAKAAPIARARLDELLPAVHFNPNQTPNMREALFTTLEEISSKAAEAATQGHNSILRLVQSQKEELDLLWWLQTGVSKDLQSPFSEFGIEKASIVLPLELADLTAFIPGPQGIFGMIISALKQTRGGAGKVSIKAGINASSREWRKGRVDQNASQLVGDLCPVSLAMAKSLETDGDDDWTPSFKKFAGLSVDEKFEARDLAYQTYCERMFVRALSELKK